MAQYLPRLLLVGILIFLSGFFSGSETALFSLNQIQRRRIGLGTTAADRALRWLLSQPRRLIATLLLGNELVNISFSTVVASLTHDLARADDPLTQTLVSMAVAVPMVLLLGEVTPKTIAIRIPETWSRVVARPLRLFAAFITPIRWFVRNLADLLIGLLGGQPPPRERPLSEDEFLSLVEQGSLRGTVDAEEREIIENVFEFGDTVVSEVMTPRERIFAIPRHMDLDEAVEAIRRAGFSRVPVYEGSLDHVQGILYAKDLVGYGLDPDVPTDMGKLIRDPFWVSADTRCSDLFRQLRENRLHLAMVRNENKETVGLVTMQDLLDELFGELTEEGDVTDQAPTEPKGEASP